LAFYRAFDATLVQNDKRATVPLPMPVLAIGGEAGTGEHVGQAMASLAQDVQSVVIPGAAAGRTVHPFSDGSGIVWMQTCFIV
jgi:hypothetical protein